MKFLVDKCLNGKSLFLQNLNRIDTPISEAYYRSRKNYFGPAGLTYIFQREAENQSTESKSLKVLPN